MSEIRYQRITLVDGTRFILRITGESPTIVRGIEVNAEGDEVVPLGADQRLRIVSRSLIKKTVDLRMSPTYATLEPAPRGHHAAAKLVNIVTDTTTLAEAMYPGGSLAAFNVGVYKGFAHEPIVPIRKLSGREVVTVAGTTAGAKVISDETWIEDRFGELGARQIKRLRELVPEGSG